jgi:hypothetical protein
MLHGFDERWDEFNVLKRVTISFNESSNDD